MSLQPIWITDDQPPDAFPDVNFALSHPNGLLAVGGDLEPTRLLSAYRSGIFPWYSDGQPILWWSPDPRLVLVPSALKVSRSLRRRIKRQEFTVSWDGHFAEVVSACAAPRSTPDGTQEGTQEGTWITEDMYHAYCRLHELGYGHSVECWQDRRLVGGLYGVAIGRAFFGESMFSRVTDASKVALYHLCHAGYELVDCQLPSPHLHSLGARELPRRDFIEMLDPLCSAPAVSLPTRSAPPPEPSAHEQ